jgi:hypothetical protein
LGDSELEAVFARASPSDTLAAVLTEARMVLAEVDGPLDAELWGSDIVAAIGSADQADAIVTAAERAGSPEALATLRVLAAVGSPQLRATASAAAGRLAALGAGEPAWADSVGAPSPGHCWSYGDARGQQEAVTMSFWYGDSGHVVSVLLDREQGGGIKNVWVGASEGVLERTREMSLHDPGRRAGPDGPGDRRGGVPAAAGRGRQRRVEAGHLAGTHRPAAPLKGAGRDGDAGTGGAAGAASGRRPFGRGL